MSAGGMGDLIGQLPAIKFVLDTHINVDIALWVQSYAVEFCRKVFEQYSDRISVDSLDNSKNKYYENLQARTPYTPHLISNLSWHITDHAFATLVGRSVDPEYMNYIKLDPIDVSEFNLPEKYVVMSTAYTSETRKFKPEYIKEVSEYCISKGYAVVYLGKKATYADKNNTIIGKIEADTSNGIDLIDRTNLFQAHAIMANATCVIGLDNGLCPHLAAMSDVPIVVGFTTLDPKHRLPYRHDKLGWDCLVVQPSKEELACIGCQSNMNFMNPSFSFTTCAYDDFKCVDIMTPDRWIKQLEKVL